MTAAHAMPALTLGTKGLTPVASLLTPDALIAVAKAIGDLDDLVRATIQGTSQAKPWQRLLLGQLKRVERQLEILRLAIAIERPDSEILETSGQLHEALSLIDAQTTKSRADATTKAAIRLAATMARLIRDALATSDAKH